MIAQQQQLNVEVRLSRSVVFLFLIKTIGALNKEGAGLHIGFDALRKLKVKPDAK